MDPMSISEIFLSIQGEGVRAGRPCVLVRLAGCDLSCAWCDTGYARDRSAGERMGIDDVLHRVADLRCPLVEVTGGEPMMQPTAPALLTALCDAGYETLLETAGSRDIAALDRRAIRIVDVKCPSSGMSGRMHWPNLEHLRSADEAKFVCADRADYDYARDVITRYHLFSRCTVLLGPVTGSLEPATLAEWMLHDRLNARLNLQLHKMIWPNEERGR